MRLWSFLVEFEAYVIIAPIKVSKFEDLLEKWKENKIFSKQFVTTEPMKYGLKFSVLSMIIKQKKTY